MDKMDVETEKLWLDTFADENTKKLYDRCEKGYKCDKEKEIVMYKGVDTINTVLTEMEEYKIQAYKTFQYCFEDLKNGRRDERQVTAEQAKEYKEKYDSPAVQNAMKFLTYFEKQFTCSGICDTSLFFFTLRMD